MDHWVLTLSNRTQDQRLYGVQPLIITITARTELKDKHHARYADGSWVLCYSFRCCEQLVSVGFGFHAPQSVADMGEIDIPKDRPAITSQQSANHRFREEQNWHEEVHETTKSFPAGSWLHRVLSSPSGCHPSATATIAPPCFNLSFVSDGSTECHVRGDNVALMGCI